MVAGHGERERRRVLMRKGVEFRYFGKIFWKRYFENFVGRKRRKEKGKRKKKKKL